MDNQNQNQKNPQPQDPEPQVQPLTTSPPSIQKPLKIVQPSEEMMKEMAANPDSYYTRNNVPNVSATQNILPMSPDTALPQSSTTQPNPNNIYPEVNNSNQPWNKPPTDDKKDGVESFNFSNGYSIGGSIFFLQFIAGLVLGLILLGIDYSVLKTANISVIAAVSLLYYLVEFFILAYIPYNTLKSNNIENPFWLTVFGIASQVLIIGVLFELVDILIIHAITDHAVSSVAIHVGGTGLVGGAIVVYIVFLIACYFLTKLAWGIAFSLFGKITNKLVTKLIGIGMIAIIIGGLGYHYLTLHKAINNSTATEIAKIPKQVLGSAYTNPVINYQITPPAGWNIVSTPQGTINGQKTQLTFWYYKSDYIDSLKVFSSSPISGSIQADVQDWENTEQTDQSDYKVVSSYPTTINGIPAYYIQDEWTSKTLKPENISDQIVIEDYEGTLYQVSGFSYSQYSSLLSSVIKKSLFSFKP